MKPIVWTLPVQEKAVFIPAGCLHHPIGENELLEEWVNEVRESPNGFTILMGDTSDAARTHYRDHLKHYRSDLSSQLQLDEWQRKDVQKLAKTLEPIKHKIIGAILGNHYWEYADGTNSEQYLCQCLGIRYLGPTGIVRLEFRDSSGRQRNALTLWAHHSGGSSGGRTISGDVAAMMKAEGAFDADIYCLSHTHRREVVKEPLLTLTAKGEPRIVERTKVFIRTGAFLKGYAEDEPTTTKQHIPGYAEQKAYRPTSLGYVKLTIQHRGDYTPVMTVSY